jgi:beta-apo-4'-carotenal oxygenase
MESLISVRYPPYAGKLAKLRKLKVADQKPNFDRQGREIKGVGYWVGFVFGLGSNSLKGALARWMVVALVAIGLKKAQGSSSSLPPWLR